MHEVKCTQCQSWYAAEETKCTQCGTPKVVHKTFAPEQDHRTINPFEMALPTWDKNKTQNPVLRFVKNVLIGAQWTMMLIGGALAWMTYWVAV